MEPASWMKDFYKNDNDQPIVADNNGGFIVQQSGLYLIYSSVREINDSVRFSFEKALYSVCAFFFFLPFIFF
jgi:hypothetical protein